MSPVGPEDVEPSFAQFDDLRAELVAQAAELAAASVELSRLQVETIARIAELDALLGDVSADGIGA